jgi:restriction endonuclease S subunit
MRKGTEVGHDAYAEKGVPFLRVADYTEKETTTSNSNHIRRYLYDRLKKLHKPDPGEIIFSKDGTVGRAIVVTKNNHEFIVSSGIVILTPKDIDNHYLAFVLNSSICRFQATRDLIGAIIQHLSLEKAKEIKVPILPESTRQKISNLVQQSFKLRQESKTLIEEAKKEVEEMIEKER